MSRTHTGSNDDMKCNAENLLEKNRETVCFVPRALFLTVYLKQGRIDIFVKLASMVHCKKG